MTRRHIRFQNELTTALALSIIAMMGTLAPARGWVRKADVAKYVVIRSRNERELTDGACSEQTRFTSLSTPMAL